MPNSNIRIAVDKNVPYIAGLLDPYAEVSYLAPEDITPEVMRNIDGLITRTRTRCNAELLAKSPCKIIATATIGTDHIDTSYCSARSIVVANAPGCNAPAVAQYVFGALMATVNRPLVSQTIGIVGAGHVGSIVARWAEGLGMKVMRCDPPRERAGDEGPWYSLADLARHADIITFHTPLTHDGPDATYHLADEAFVGSLRRAPIIINSARGPVTDTAALIAGRRSGAIGGLIIDCWEGEPAIDAELLALADIATPHIAGYSAEGKVRASQAALDAITTFFMLPRITVPQPLPPAPARHVTLRGIVDSYNPAADSAALKEAPASFEQLRNGYKLRHEAPEGSER